MFLPISKEDMSARGWTQCDFIFITGDAYVDHPTFGTAIISRVLENAGYKVGIIAQPNWRTDTDFLKLGTPKYGFMVNAGNIDSMVAHYTVAKKPRSQDAYSPGHKMGLRPDRCLTVYCKKLREIFRDIPIIVGGLEASLRRFAHYDYWADRVFPSVLSDCMADALIFGMGERQTVKIADAIKDGNLREVLRELPGVCYFTENPAGIKGLTLPSFEICRDSKEKYAEACRIEYDEQDAVRGKRLIQPHGKRYLVQNPPMPPLDTTEMDAVYELPYERYYHPIYESMGGVPAIEEVEFSITHNRGCFGACNFCSIAFHQGRQVTVRSTASVLREAEMLTRNPHFKGYIHDVGGPTANFRLPSCEKQLKSGLCKGKKCLAPTPCKNLQVDHREYVEMLRQVRALPKIKKVFIRSGVRFDYLMEDESRDFFHELVKYHVSGQLKVAPEHCSAAVLDRMGKPHIEVYKRFANEFYKYTKSIDKEQYLVPYLMSSHPGSTLKDAVELALFLKHEKMRPEQVQDFYPTPGTLSTAMYYTGLDPHTMKPVFTPKTAHEKQMQRALLQYFRPQNRAIVREALIKAGRQDLIGSGPNCLIPGTVADARGDFRKTNGKNSGKGGRNGGKNGVCRQNGGRGKNGRSNGRPKSRLGGKWEPKRR